MPENSRANLPFPLPDQAVTTFNIDSEAVHARLLYPFLPDYVGQRNPYNGEIIQSSDDYERYLREHCYYNRCAREFHSIRVRLEDALDENLRLSSAASKSEKLSECNRRLTTDNENLKKTEKRLLNQRKELQATVSKQKKFLRIFIALFCLVFTVCVLLSFSSFASPSGKNKLSATSYLYIGNSQTKTIHESTCSHLPYKKYRVEFHSLARAVIEGYSRCQYCLGWIGQSDTSASHVSSSSSTSSTCSTYSIKQTEP